MSHHGNDELKQSLFENLLDEGFTDDQIIKHDMVEKLFFQETTIESLLRTYPDRAGISETLEGATREEEEEESYYSDPEEPYYSYSVSDDADALASAGWGTDEDYGGYDAID